MPPGAIEPPPDCTLQTTEGSNDPTPVTEAANCCCCDTEIDGADGVTATPVTAAPVGGVIVTAQALLRRPSATAERSAKEGDTPPPAAMPVTRTVACPLASVGAVVP